MFLTTIACPAKSHRLLVLGGGNGGGEEEPSTLTKLKAEAFAESVDPEEVKRSARSTWNHARACRAVAGTRFKGSLKKIVKGLEH